VRVVINKLERALLVDKLFNICIESGELSYRSQN